MEKKKNNYQNPTSHSSFTELYMYVDNCKDVAQYVFTFALILLTDNPLISLYHLSAACFISQNKDY